jgi:hypothetical protein
MESFCRVKTLSLTGKLLYVFVDVFIVQWMQLVSKKYKKIVYLGDFAFNFSHKIINNNKKIFIRIYIPIILYEQKIK